MKIYLLKEEDFETLLAAIDRDPHHGERGGSSVAMSEIEDRAHAAAHRFYNYQVRRWLDRVRQ